MIISRNVVIILRDLVIISLDSNTQTRDLAMSLLHVYEKIMKSYPAQFMSYSSTLLNQCIIGVTFNFDLSMSFILYNINVWP